MLLPGGVRGAAFRAWAWAWARGRAGVAGVSSVPSGSPGTPSGSPGTPSASLSTPSASPETPSGPPSAPAVPEPRRGPGPLPPPVLRSCRLPPPAGRRPVQAWVGSLLQPDAERRGLADLHPEVFAVRPRLDILHAVAMWQKNFKRISYAKVKSRAEVRGGGRKPWRQKGSGRARQGSTRSPLWRGGGIAHGPRGPTSYFYMLPMKLRVLGLKVALTVKLMQDELFVVQSLELPSPDPQYLQALARARRWGRSVLFVDVREPPPSLQAAAANLKTFTLIPALGLNVYSILKHQSLVLTLGTVSLLEEKLLWHDARFCALYPFAMPYRDLP